jgi:hypothetical protein
MESSGNKEKFSLKRLFLGSFLRIAGSHYVNEVKFGMSNYT